MVSNNHSTSPLKSFSSFIIIASKDYRYIKLHLTICSWYNSKTQRYNSFPTILFTINKLACATFTRVTAKVLSYKLCYPSKVRSLYENSRWSGSMYLLFNKSIYIRSSFMLISISFLSKNLKTWLSISSFST